MVKVSQKTDIGLVRSLNEDSVLVLAPHIYVVADGMGGHVAGEIASHILTETIQKGLEDNPAICLNQDGLRELVVDGHYAIREHMSCHPEHQGMGTTATLLHIENGIGYWAHVGDSRLYLLRQGELRQLTKDHTYVAELFAAGRISASEAESHPSRNMLLRAVGADKYVEVDSGELEIYKGDIFLLCSDGLTNMVSLPAIQTVLEATDCVDKAGALIDIAKAGGGLDNISAIVVEYYEE